MAIIQKIKNYVGIKQHIFTPKGIKPISKIKIGDIVVGVNGLNKVNKIKIIKDEKSHIVFNNGDFSFYKNQTVWVNGSWKHAYQIKAGDIVKDRNNKDIKIISIKKNTKTIPFYRLDVSGDHTYYIDNILVHNASRYWVGGTGTWQTGITTHWAASSGGAGGASVPTSADDVYFDEHSNEPGDTDYTCTIIIASCNNLDVSYTGTSKVTLSVSNTLNFYGNLNLSGGTAQVIVSGSGSIYFQNTDSGKTITTNGVSIGCILAFWEVGGRTIVDNLTTTNTIYIRSGTIVAANITISSNVIQQQSFSTASLDISNSTITCTGWGFSVTTGMTLTATGSSITVNGTYFYGGGLTYAAVIINPTATFAITGANTFTALTVNGDDNKRTLTFAADQIITGTLTLNGNSITNRLFVSSYTTAIQTISAGTLITQYTDWRNITAAGAANWDLTDQSIDSFGDCLGNTGITFTTPADQHWVNADGGNWGDAANWTSRVPLPQDDVFMDCAFGTSKTVTANVANLGKNIDWSGATWTTSLAYVATINATMYGSLTLISGLTGAATNTLSIRTEEDITIISHSVVLQALLLYALETATIYLGDNINTGSKIIILYSGIFSAVNGENDYSITAGGLREEAGTIILGSETHTISGTTGCFFSGDVNAGTSTIKLTFSGTGFVIFQGGSTTLYNVWVATAGLGYVMINGSNTFNDLKIDAGRTVKFENGSTQILETLTAVGTAGNIITLINSSGTTAFHLSKSSGIVNCDYLNLSFSDATGGALWFAGSHSTNTIGNSGWRFVDLKTKELTEIIRAVSALARTRFAELTESIKSISELTSLNGLLCNETVKAVLIFFAPFFKVLTQSLKVIPTYARVPGWYKIYSERVIVAPVLSVIRSLHNTFSEVIRVVSSRTMEAGKTFTQRLVAVSAMIKNTGRIFSEIINLSEITAIFTTAKTFIENVIVAPVYERLITAYKEFTETVKAAGNILNNIGREFIESIAIPEPVMESLVTLNAVLTEIIRVFVEPMYEWTEKKPTGSYADNYWQDVACSGDGSVIIVCDGYYNLHISTDYGANWTDIDPLDNADNGWISVSCDSTGEIMITSDYNGHIFISENYGADWAEFIPNSVDPSSYQQVLIGSNSYVLLARDLLGRIYFSIDLGANWDELTNDTGGCIKLSIDTSGRFAVGLINGFVFMVDSNTLSLSQLNIFNEEVIAPYNFSDIAMYYDESNGYDLRVIICINGGRIRKVDWRISTLWEEIQPAGDSDQAWAGVKISGNGNIMLAYTVPGRIYISNDSGVTWNELHFAGDVDQYWAGLALNNTGTQIEAMIFSGRYYQILKISGNFIFEFGREFSEVIRAIPELINLSVLVKVLDETVIAAENLIRNIGRSFAEIVRAVSGIAKQAGRIFTQAIKIFVLPVKAIGAKALIDTITASDNFDRLLTWKKLLTEAIIINWGKLTLRSKDYAERLVVRTAKPVFTAGKVCLEIIVGATNWLFRKTIHTELTDVIKVSANLVNSIIRIFRETVRITAGFIVDLARVFAETLTVATDFLASYSKTLLETIIIPSLDLLQSWTIGKLLNEVITIRIIFTEGRLWIMTETIKVVSGLTNLTGRILNETINITVLLTRSIGRTLSQIVKIASTVEFTHTLYKVLSDSLKVSGTAIKSVGKTFIEAVLVVGAMGEQVIAKLLKETVKMADYVIAVFTREFVETITISANAVIAWSVTFVEIVSVAGEFVLGTISKVISEIINAGQIFEKETTKVLNETLIVLDGIILQPGKVLTDSFVVAGTFIIDSISKLLSETIKIIEVYSKVWTLSRIYSEIISVSGIITKQAGRIFTQVIKVVQPAPVIVFTIILTQIIKVGGVATKTISRSFSEIVKVVLVFSNQMNLVFTNTIKVISAMGNFVIGKLLIQTIFFKLNKTRLLLNGIQVGLWKKIARVTNGVWKKISRNDN